MSKSNPSMGFAGPGIMLLSAALFGYFGFGITWLTTGNGGQFLFYVALMEWTLKISSIGFLVAALITFGKPLIGNLLYSIVGLLGAIAFAIVLALDLLDPQHMTVTPILLIIFVAWNGYGSWMGLKEVLAARRSSSVETF
jgi:hypothetical protein